MGMRCSAGWAQCVTDTVTDQIALVDKPRLHPDRPMPATLPVWGSIIDDVWYLEETDPGGAAEGPGLLDLVSDRWGEAGVAADAAAAASPRGSVS